MAMTRAEKIRQEALNWKTDDNEFIAQTAFEAGARWADEHPKSPWISVKDRLPETGCSVLLHFASVIDPQLGLFHEYEGNKYWILTFGSQPFEAVDYWMPIPELNKSENQ